MLRQLLAGFRRLLLNIATSGTADPEEWLLDAFRGGRKSAAGIIVNHKTALAFSSVYSVINLISGDVAKLPTHLNRTLPAGGKERAIDHPSYALVATKSSPELTAFHFKKLMVAVAALRGNSYAYIRRRGMRPFRLDPLDSSRTNPVRIAGELFYETEVERTDGRYETVTLSPMDVFHLRELTCDGILGYSRIDLARDTIGLGLALQEFGSRFFGQGLTASGIVTYDKQVPPDQRDTLRKQILDQHASVKNSHGLMLLDNGAKYTPLTVAPEQAQFLMSRRFQRQEIAAWWNVPAHKIGDDVGRRGYASVEQEEKSYLSCLEPWLIAFEQECWDKLLTEQEKASGVYGFEFLRAAMLKPDTKTRFDIYAKACGRPILLVNEARDMENLPPVEGGDELFSPLNMGSAAGELAAEEPSAEVVDAQRELLVATLTQSIRREVSALVRMAKKPKGFCDAFAEFYDDQEQRIVDAVSPVARFCEESLGLSVPLAKLAADYVAESRRRMAQVVESANYETLTAEVEAETADWQSRAEEFADLVFADRAQKVAA